jgi:hypothetical protein
MVPIDETGWEQADAASARSREDRPLMTKPFGPEHQGLRQRNAKTHRLRKTGADAFQARLTALPVHHPLSAAGLLAWPAWPLAN